MLCLLVVPFLLSSKSCFSHWGTAFFEEFTLFGGVLACLLSLKSCSACCVICFLASSKICFTCGVVWLVGLLGLWGCLACGVAWLVGLLGLWGCLACGVAWLVGLLALLGGGLLSLAFQFL